jgi:predicted TIM-barrel fold metal-dependent hydrolase
VTAQRIDVHHHYVTAELVEELARAGIHHVGGQPLAPARPEDSLAVMDRYEIAGALLSVPVPLTFPDRDTACRVARSLNEAGARAVADAPDRFGLFAALPLPDVDGALAELEYALDALHADGVLLLSNHAGVYLGDPRLEPVFAELDRRGAVVFVHPAEPLGGSPVGRLEASLFEFVFDTTRAVANLVGSGTLERCANVQMIVAHAGGTIPYLHDRVLDRRPILERVAQAPPPTQDELQRMLSDGLARSRRQLQRLFYDVTLAAGETALGCLQQLVPGTQIVFGTDYPMAQEIGLANTLTGLERHPGLDLRAIETDNARRLFPRLADALVTS